MAPRPFAWSLALLCAGWLLLPPPAGAEAGCFYWEWSADDTRNVILILLIILLPAPMGFFGAIAGLIRHRGGRRYLGAIRWGTLAAVGANTGLGVMLARDEEALVVLSAAFTAGVVALCGGLIAAGLVVLVALMVRKPPPAEPEVEAPQRAHA